MIKIAVLTANLGKFDTDVENVKQVLHDDMEMTFHRWTDDNFPPITGLTPRFQYRIPKMFGWQMMRDYDYYLWLDGSMSLQDPTSLRWFMRRAKDVELVIFKHPDRKTIREEVDYIDLKLREGNKYITSRYKNGLHKEQLMDIMQDPQFVDDRLYASTVFLYQNTARVREMMKIWWIHQSRYFTCDQIALPYAIRRAGVSVYEIDENPFKCKYVSITSKHS